MNRSLFRQLLWIVILITIATVYGCNRNDYIPLGKENLVPVVMVLSGKDDKDDFIPDNSITTNIRYTGESLKHGIYPIILRYTIINTSDSVKYIEPPRTHKIRNNPVLFLTDSFGNPVPRKRSEVVISDLMPPISEYYVKLLPHDSISYQIKIDDYHRLTQGQKYYIHANYISRYVLVRDSSSERKSYCNVSNSNLLEYRYEE